MAREWQLQQAKNRLSELVDMALSEGPQVVTRRGKEAVVVVSAEEYRRLAKPQPSFKAFLRSTALGELDLERERDTGRDVELP